MRRYLIIPIAIALASGCADSSSEQSESVSGVGSTTTVSSSAATSPGGAESTTSAAGAAVTFVTAAETTVPPTTEVLDPTSLVIGRWGVLGSWDGSSWSSTNNIAPEEIPALAGDVYRVLALGESSSSTVVGAELDVICEPIGNWGVPSVPALDSFGGRFPAVAVRAQWDVQPRLPEVLSGQPVVYVDAIGQFLSSHGLGGSAPVIHQILRVDLEGDGVDEVFIAAESIVGEWPFAQPGDYSLVLMRKVVQGDVQVGILGFSFVPPDADPDQFPYMERFAINALADLNGDSKLEVLVDSEYYEGVGVEAFEYIDDDLGLVAVLGTGCGA